MVNPPQDLLMEFRIEFVYQMNVRIMESTNDFILYMLDILEASTQYKKSFVEHMRFLKAVHDDFYQQRILRGLMGITDACKIYHKHVRRDISRLMKRKKQFCLLMFLPY